MPDPIFHHERIYRTAEAMARFERLLVTICGAGALGGNVADGLARSGFRRLRVVDHDRVEERNLSTQPYQRADVGALKARVLAATLYRAVGVEVDPRHDALSPANAIKLLGESGLVIDCFDNAASRRAVGDACRQADIPCLHAGLAADYAEILWDEVYRVPSDGAADVCDYPLARNLVMLAAALTCEIVVGFAADGQRRNLTATLGDLSVRTFPL